ncbi:hypothetical protein E1283_34525, partial [Streptomyces hainanensis]
PRSRPRRRRTRARRRRAPSRRGRRPAGRSRACPTTSSRYATIPRTRHVRNGRSGRRSSCRAGSARRACNRSCCTP